MGPSCQPWRAISIALPEPAAFRGRGHRTQTESLGAKIQVHQSTDTYSLHLDQALEALHNFR